MEPEKRNTTDTENKTIVTDQEFEVIKERIKERPINRKKLLRRTVMTVSFAVIFGLIACLTFLVLEPVFSNWLYPEEEPKPVTFPQVEEEILPEDMVQTDSQLEENQEEEQPEQVVTETIVEKVDLEITDYQLLYNKLFEVAKECSKSMVTVTGVKSDVDWFNNPYESKGQAFGLIIADNGKGLLILADKKAVEEAETIQVTFSDGTQAMAEMAGSDLTTGLAVISVSYDLISQNTLNTVTIAKLGSSSSANLAGSPVIALGSPMGMKGSVVYGMLTSVGNTVSVVDNSYKSMTTDIYGSTDAGGVLISMKGDIIGLINMSYSDDSNPNLITALGITELKKTIEKLSNHGKLAYLGIHGIDVSQQANQELGVPFGAFVTEISVDSPAMQHGIQSGDVIVKIGNIAIEDFNSYVNAIMALEPEDTVTITIMRQGQDEYREMSFDITLDSQES
ncbi:MAG: S1C family serine protease [Lachnospiraceae bacterium]|nr:S1C family serine protease [Lachnospiraceae bacterium]MDD3659445.1 S1C family serine protease [Lachnospiraceae bacterium]